MLRITIDLVPFGDEEGTEKIGEMIIGNIAMLDNNRSNYVYGYRDNHGAEKIGLVNNFDRSAGSWELVSACLNAPNKAVPQLLQGLVESEFTS